MADKPDKLPEWASVTDGSPNDITHLRNVEEPPDDKKARGWDYLEFPVRNWFNWLHQKTYQWFNFLSKEQARRIAIAGRNVDLTLKDQMILVYVICKVDPTLFYVGIGYVDADGNVVTVNQISANGMSIDTYGYDLTATFTDTDPTYHDDDILFVVEQLGMTNEP